MPYVSRDKTYFMILRFLFITYVIVTLSFSSGCKKDDNVTRPKVSTAQVIAILPGSATCGGNITRDGGSEVSARGVVWSKSAIPTLENNVGKTTDGAGTGSFVSNLSALTSNTSYFVRAYATNSAGTSYGMFVTFTTETVSGTFTDTRDGNAYKWVEIGTRVWMAENLKYLPDVAGPAAGSQTTPYYYVYGYDGTSVPDAMATANYTTYGVLYNWEAACSSCPEGWHLPGDTEWTELTSHLGGHDVAGGELKETGTTHWMNPNTGATNKTKFTALPGGHRTIDGTFIQIGGGGIWWSSTESSIDYAWYRGIGHDYSGVYRRNDSKVIGFSVRCVRD